MRKQRGFTLIELLVVIAIIGILATLVIVQLAGAQVRARNSQAKSDVTEMGKAVETWKTNTSNDVVPVTPLTAVTISTASTSLCVAGNGADWCTVFKTGFPTSVTKTPSTAYTYTYASDLGAGARPAVGSVSMIVSTNYANNYCIASNVVNASGVVDTGFWVNNGSTGNSTTAAPTINASTGVCS